MTLAEEIQAAKNQSHWTAKQRNHLRRLIKSGATIAYWNSDEHGRPANAINPSIRWVARPGLVQVVNGPLCVCTQYALHGTFEPHRWRGCRVWLAGFVGEIAISEDHKIGALHREIIGEILPEEALNASVGVRIGRKDLSGANLRGANLRGANLTGANLYYANLSYANLSYANLYGANLTGANLTGANLYYANLSYANLSYANLYGANLRGANLTGANLYDANLSYANLSYANLYGANLRGANLTGANLDHANLYGANLTGANLDGALAITAPPGWRLVDGRLTR